MTNAVTDAALTPTVLSVALLLYCDFSGDPLRCALAPMPIATAAGFSGDPDLDGHAWSIASPEALSVGEVTHQSGGSDTLTLTLSASPLDTTVMNVVDNPALYAGRLARIWLVLIDSYGNAVAQQHFYTGYMSVPSVTVGAQSMQATLDVENFTALVSAAPGRTYLIQSQFDAGDLSASAAHSAGNATGATGYGGYGGGRFGAYGWRPMIG
jgi:hypothetical protein